jgi:hypothetical protein
MARSPATEDLIPSPRRPPPHVGLRRPAPRIFDHGKHAMSGELKPGDRVRVTTLRPVHGYQPGSRGVVRSGPHTDRGGKTYYLVAMDQDASEDATLFLDDEIELDTQ